jgi:hypothetical protein
MKMKRLLFLSVLVLTLMTTLLLAAGPAAAQATRTEFKVRETWVWDDPDVPGRGWVSGDKIFHGRGGASHYLIDAFPGEKDLADPRVFGDEIITGNLNMKLVDDECIWAAGPMSGTFRITNEGGYWEGIWTGVRDEQGHSFAYMVGKGGGGYKGLQIRINMERATCDWTQPETYTGYILDPGK